MRKRPCKICRKWFLPNPRAGDRQRTCSEPACQRERHRRACSDWHRRNPDYDRESRLRARLVHAKWQRARHRHTTHEDQALALPGLHPADPLIVHPVFVLKALEPVQPDVQQAGYHVHQIAIAVPDETYACVQHGR